MSDKRTFGELSIGARFISFPRDGDNSGHGGYLGAHYIFRKTEERASVFGPAQNAFREKDGTHSHMPDGMFVLEVQ